MAPKKRKGDEAGPSGTKPESYDKTRFMSEKAAKTYKESLKKKKLKIERGFNYEVMDKQPEFWREFKEKIERNGWTTFVEHPDEVNEHMVREFYANLSVITGNIVMVRGKNVAFDSNTINSHFELPRVLVNEYANFKPNEDELRELSVRLSGGLPKWETRKSDRTLKNFPRGSLTPLAKIWYYFVVSSIFPSGHSSSISKDRAIMLDCILQDRAIDFGKLINSEIKRTARTKSLGLWYAGLITELCIEAGVAAKPSDTKVEPQAPIDDNEVNQLMLGGHPPLPELPRRVPMERRMVRMEQRVRRLDDMIRHIGVGLNLDMSAYPPLPEDEDEDDSEEEEGSSSSSGGD